MDTEEENREAEKSRVRVFVGGLGEGVTSDDLRRLFGSLGGVDGVDIIRTKGRSFAYVDFIPSPTDQNTLSKLFSRYNGCLWKGGKLKLEKAKEHYLVRLKREWEEDAKLAIDEHGTSPHPDKSISSTEILSKEILKTKKLNIFFPKLRKVKSIPFTGTGKHKYSFPKVEIPPLPVHFCDCEEHSSPSGTIRPKQFHNGGAESGGMNDEEINIMNVVMSKLFEREKMPSPMHFEKEKSSNVSPGGLQSDESEADSATDDDGLIINIETKKKKTAIKGSQELQRILRDQESELSEGARILKDEANNNKLEVPKSSNIAPDKKKKPHHNSEGKRNDNTSVTPGGKKRVHWDELSSQVHLTELEDNCREPAEVSWSQKSSWRELLGDGGSSSFSASHMLLGSNSIEKKGSDGLCEPESGKNKTEHIVMEGGLEPARAEEMEVLAETRPTTQDAASKQSGRGVAWKQKQSWTQLIGQNTNSFSISQILPGISSQKPVAKEPSEDLAGSGDSKHIDLGKESDNEAVGGGLNLAKSNPEKEHNMLAKHSFIEPVGDGLNMTRSTPEKSQHVAGNDTAPAPMTEEKCDGHTNETSITEVKMGETCSFMRSAASLKEWAKTKAAWSGSLKRKRGEKNEH
ncbi:protein REPRESSOR OF SILENCING 3 [Prosopis cineraria]|uniref:protein REPRESSOR OF SILENCING 3 n=1 Tax=Prosopis cineraria TaxID=364024 RepID=UPI00240EE1CD|nr:protein REPRESSOR OF SILENCING 3 [Prosopis cineraria]